MRISDSRLPRRWLLTAAAGTVGVWQLSGCKPAADRGDQGRGDPLEPVLATAVYLADRHQRAMSSIPSLAERLAPLRESHLAHITALTRELGTAESGKLPSGRPPDPAPATSGGAPSASAPSAAATPVPLPSDPAAALADLRSLELAGQRQAAAACLSGVRNRAALVGSIAAARAGHAEALA